ncbi:MAG: adenylate/guanylate cyclase domain-containing protein [Verrucomicrobia bacterium]|nr:adenylate/guanylate cyclase domain-containing protein [Verrucomicrobiota bacterium]
MKFRFKPDRFLIFFFVFLGVLLISLLGCLIYLRDIHQLQIKSSQERHDAYVIATELRSSSNDLTTMVRMYVITGNKKYKDHFFEILAIRNGEAPRPVRYDLIYWDLVDDDVRPRPFLPAKSLQQLMIEHGFTVGEFELLHEAQDKSDQLARMEIAAINAMEGNFDDGSGKYTRHGPPDPQLAKDLVFGDEYMQMKKEIMTPILQFFENVEIRTTAENKELIHKVNLLMLLALALSAISTVVMLISIIKALNALNKATQDSEMLLLNILPSPIAARLKGGEEPIADEYPQASVLFADIVGFTKMTHTIGAKKMVDLLNQLFAEFDNLTEVFGVEKIKTIGDSYMAVAGIPIPMTDHAAHLADFALAMKQKLDEFNRAKNVDFKVRVGMTYGTVIAGVIGHKKFIYDLWGDVVNTASRLESTGIPGEIQISEKMALMLEDNFTVIPSHKVEAKGLGSVQTYLLKGRKL